MRTSLIAAVSLVVTALLPLGVAPAMGGESVQTWTVTMGVCSDWRGTWAMQHVGAGHWIGTSVIQVASNQCTQKPVGTQMTSNVDFTTTVNGNWHATSNNTANGDSCNYSGTVNANNSASGTYRCTGQTGAPSNILITSPVDFYRKSGG